MQLADLEPRWNGEFQLLWKPLLSEPANLSLGMSGAAVLALRMRLQQAMGVPADEPVAPDVMPDYFDESLQQLVLEFQRDHGLVQDGVAGWRTRALLDTQLAAPGTPLLSLVIR